MIKTLIISFFIAVLSGLGIGSGGLLVIFLTSFASLPQISAQGINLVFFIFSAAASTLISLKTQKIFWKTVSIMSLFGILGCFFGTVLAEKLGNEILRKIFGGMLIITGVISVIKAIRSKGE